MKKILFSLILTIIAIGMFGFVTSHSTFAKGFQGTHNKTTGEFVATAGGAELGMIIAVHDTDPNKGNVQYSNSLGKSFIGEATTCYAQEGAHSVFAGKITGGYYDTKYEYFKVWTYDGGEGEFAENPDKVRVVLLETAPTTCTVYSLLTSYPGTVGEGNIQVHTK